MYNYTGVAAAGESDPVPLGDSFYLILLFHEHMYGSWEIVRMWVENEGVLSRKESDVSLSTALLITFPIEDDKGSSATEVKRSLLGCAGSHPRWTQQHCASALSQTQLRSRWVF